MPSTLSLCVATLCAVLALPSAASDCVSQAIRGLESESPSTAVAALARDGDRGDVRCKYILGMWSLSGTGVEVDYAKGFRLLEEAAKAGLPAAQANLGVLYASGVGIERNDEEAVRWYRSAAERGDALGQRSLGAARFLGVGVEQDSVFGYKWTQLAADQGDETARAHLTVMAVRMSTEDLRDAGRGAAAFRPMRSAVGHRPTRSEMLRLFGIRGHPTEIDRFD